MKARKQITLLFFFSLTQLSAGGIKQALDCDDGSTCQEHK